jgi:small subunit ribosomal protein S19
MPRSQKKGPFVHEKLFRKAVNAKESGARMPVKVWSRASTIVPEFVGQNFEVHNGKTFIKVFITEDMVGHKFGEFAPTRTFRGHTAAKAKAAPGA